MSSTARLKQYPGGSRAITAITAASTIFVPHGTSVCEVTGTTAVNAIHSGPPIPGRRVTFIGGTSSRDFVNSSSAAVYGGMHLGSASEISLAANDVLVLVQLASGGWLRVYSTDN